MVLNHFIWGYIENTVDGKKSCTTPGVRFLFNPDKIYFRTPWVVQDFFPINNMIIWCLMNPFNLGVTIQKRPTVFDFDSKTFFLRKSRGLLPEGLSRNPYNIPFRSCWVEGSRGQRISCFTTAKAFFDSNVYISNLQRKRISTRQVHQSSDWLWIFTHFGRWEKVVSSGITSLWLIWLKLLSPSVVAV